jgi:hypothetical protein
MAEISTIPPKWNPFDEVKTRVSIPGSYILPTCSSQSLSHEKARFISTLVDEAIVYFPSEGNIDPALITSEESISEEKAFDLYESSYETKITETLSSPTNPVAGKVIFIVQPYGNKEKSLTKVLNNLNAAASNIDWPEKIRELRENSLKIALEQQEKEKALEGVEESKKTSKRKQKKESTLDQEVKDEWSTNSTDTPWDDDSFLRSEIEDVPDSWLNDDPDKKF